MPARRCVIHVIRQVCHSLSEAESISLVHRDIKPANIFLCDYGAENTLRQSAGLRHRQSDSRARRHRSGDRRTVISPHHTSSAVHRRSSLLSRRSAGGAVDHRADIYATGCLAYWLLTGELVFTGDTPMQLLVQHVQAMPVPPSARTELPIPKELDAIVLTLAKNPRTDLKARAISTPT